MKRVIVIGCPGSGKSTFARALRDQTGLPLVHLDMLYWRADRTTVSHEEFDERLAKALAGECWIIDGNYQRTLEKRLSAADTVFFLDYKTAVCLDGIRARKGQARSDMPWVENETDEELCAFVESFRAKSRPQIIHLLKKQRNKQIIRFRTRAAADRFLAMLAERAQAKTDSDPL
ncbi:MAG: AAA family ATPase [Clostridia bacterium]|nr:AAA family ATPase [Clostridia bacterium]